MNSRTGWLPRQRERRIVDDLAQHRPRVGHHRDAVLADLLDEPVRLQASRQRDAGAADHRAAQADQQPGLVMQRGQAVDGVAAAEVGRRRGAERRQRPPEVGDLAGDQFAADRAERDEGQVTGQSGVGPVPAGQVDLVGVDLLHVDDVGVVGQVQVAGLAAAEHQHPHGQPARGVQIARVGDDLRHPAEPRGLARSASGGISTATAPSRDSAAIATSALGRVSISTPTCAPCRTPTSIRPRTTLLMRRSTAS